MIQNHFFREIFTVLACSIVFTSCAQIDTSTTAPETQIRPPFLIETSFWADSIISTLSTEKQIAQLLMVPVYSKKDTNGWAEAEHWVRDLGLGGIICMQGGPENQRIRIARLQKQAEIPLMVASDAEWGLGMRLDSTRSFPRSMTLGATRNPELVRSFGRIVGLSLRKTGIHVNFAPVIDVNSNPENPVIGSRSFGENVSLVGELGLAYSQGLQDVNVLATAKHFPGHGDSDSDSHKTLPQISHDRLRLDSIELAPFTTLIDGGVGAMMIAHLDVPALDSTEGQPSTLSPIIVDSLLRKEMGFEGLAFTDALSMKGFVDFAGDRPRARDALLAGNDILLFPGDPKAVIAEVMKAVSDGSIDSTFIAKKCHRVLLAKVWTGANTPVPDYGSDWEPDNAEKVHRKIIEESLTLLLNKESILPWLSPASNVAVINIANLESSSEAFSNHLRLTLGRSHHIESFTVGKDGSGWGKTNVQKACKNADLVIVNFLESSNRPSKNYGINSFGINTCSSQIQKANFDSTSNAKWVINIFANPYVLDSKWLGIQANSDALFIAYQDDYRTQEGVVDAITGVGSANGVLPVTPTDFIYSEGDGLGLDMTKVGTRLGWDSYSCEGNWAPTLLIDSIINDALAEQAFPGCRIVIAHKGRVIHDGSYGTTDGIVKVKSNTVYDLASITKVAATTLCLMHLEELGEFSRLDKLSNKLHELDTLELGTRTFLEVLSHQAGLFPWIPFYLETLSDSIDVLSEQPICDENISINTELFLCKQFVDTMYKRIIDAELKPVGNYRYSDLGYYLINKFLNRSFHSERAIDSLSNAWIYKPLGLSSMVFEPLDKFSLEEIAPTEIDTIFRKCTVHGHVHDPGAAMLGGVCGHAGLFSDAYDLTRLGFMLLNEGRALGNEIFQSSTIESWTSRAFQDGDNRRGTGFDKPSLEPDSGPTCDLSSNSSFGHTGFTGTLLWVDPKYDLVYVFLSNRTFPDAENKKLLTLNVRTEIQRVIMEHLNAHSRFENIDTP